MLGCDADKCRAKPFSDFSNVGLVPWMVPEGTTLSWEANVPEHHGRMWKAKTHGTGNEILRSACRSDA
jgi:hypothetical protein